MEPSETVWRARGAIQDAIDRVRIPLALYPRFRPDGLRDHQPAPGFRVSDVSIGEWAASGATEDEVRWSRRLAARADRLADHRLSFFTLKDQDVGHPIDWNRDHESGRKAPQRLASSIDYRNFNVTGDAKLVWEINRHHHFVVLGRAYRATGEIRYAQAVAEQLDSWLDQCPYGIGMNWRSPLELAIRLINWVWALDLIREAGALEPSGWARLLEAVSLHAWDITRKYSRASSANNHRIGEAAGVFVAASYFSELPRANAWRDESRAILAEEITLQIYPDGCTRELALGYHFFVAQFFLVAGMVARWTGQDFPPAYWVGLERMLAFGSALMEGGNELPMFGDADDGYLLDLGDGRPSACDLLAVGAVLFGRSDLSGTAGKYSETARWLLGRESRGHYTAVRSKASRRRLASRAFQESGHYLLQSGSTGAVDRISVLFDCGDLGFGPLAAHGHADALSFTVRAFGVDILVDPGTFDYFTYPDWRSYFRSTRAHNTLVVDGSDQSVMLGPFLWGARARARCLDWQPTDNGGTVQGEHDGYRRLANPVTHRRTLVLDGRTRALTIRDEVLTTGQHTIDLYFHVAEIGALSSQGSNRFEVVVPGGTASLTLDPSLSVTLLSASDSPQGGWVSRGYHRKQPSTTVVGHASISGRAVLTCQLEFGLPR